MLSEDDKQYLIKWEKQSYFRASWHSGAWTWGVTAPAMRKAFYKREDGPKMRTEDAIPEEFLRIDIVLDVKYTSYVEVRSEEIDKARIKEVDTALIKYKGLGYEDAVWEKVPTPEDDDRWLDFVTAYNDWVAGRYIRYPKPGPLKARLDKARGTPFAKLEKEKQPDNLVGGELMKYQIDGLNWIYYQWYSQRNGILADEMGLGKTIQVIGFMATLVQEHNCFPFLVVVPNSTCANWRREIKQWAPSLRVVTFFGSATARDMSYKYELYRHGSKELRCHIVVTSYEAASDDSCRRFFRSVNWAGLIVDEGQRLKNDKSQLYGALSAVKAPFRLLMTGTPLQNNARELFNLLQFLDDSINAAELEETYAEMTSENIGELHDQIRPFILRRTKAQVLTFLPPLGQIIVPVSMSSLQKSLYKSILAKNPELLKALFTTQKQLKQQERANLSNILMQLRKCLCHPFVYSREIEERTDIAAVSHRNLVEASAKLQLLELLLPKLKERGHRVLIFSQFLDMLDIVEDFMDGMQMAYQRLDGTMGSLEKQKRIDQFNAPDSPLFAFLLSTRAGGVGINLATADTVIILDPDFNPHQDIQAISRAHRIGQKKKVLCFQLMTRASAEEKIVQMGRKKMALDHVVVEQLDAEDMEDKDVESILKHGAAELFKDDADHDIRYDEFSIEKLLDRTQIENTKTSADDSAESQFSFARLGKRPGRPSRLS
jgi:SNF2 family DNA or RNA helicase